MPWKVARSCHAVSDCLRFESWEAHLQMHQQGHTPRQPSQGYGNDHSEVSVLFIQHLTPLMT